MYNAYYTYTIYVLYTVHIYILIHKLSTHIYTHSVTHTKKAQQ